eukprot:365952-Chlamydomonas_euryale.AAC.11
MFGHAFPLTGCCPDNSSCRWAIAELHRSFGTKTIAAVQSTPKPFLTGTLLCGSVWQSSHVTCTSTGIQMPNTHTQSLGRRSTCEGLVDTPLTSPLNCEQSFARWNFTVLQVVEFLGTSVREWGDCYPVTDVDSSGSALSSSDVSDSEGIDLNLLRPEVSQEAASKYNNNGKELNLPGLRRPPAGAPKVVLDASTELLNKTSSDVTKRIRDFKAGLEAHFHCNELLRANNIPLPKNGEFSYAIRLCRENKLLESTEDRRLTVLNQRANAAKHHCWGTKFISGPPTDRVTGGNPAKGMPALNAPRQKGSSSGLGAPPPDAKKIKNQKKK